MNPRLILAVILGGMTGVFTLSVLGGGLVSPASPGSILAVLAMTPKGRTSRTSRPSVRPWRSPSWSLLSC
jgi:mannitol-specific phosphotransferase system IIBC component